MAKQEFSATEERAKLINDSKVFTLAEGGKTEVNQEKMDAILDDRLKADGYSLDTFVKQQAIIADVVNATTLAYGQFGVDCMKADKELKDIDAAVKIGRDRLSLTFIRSQEVSGGAGAPRKMKQGLLRFKYDVAGSKKAGHMKTVLDRVSELAKEAEL